MHTELNSLNISVLAAAWFELLKDSPVDDGKTFRQGVRFYNRLANDLRGVTRDYAELNDALLRSLLHTNEGTVATPLFREFARTPVFREYHHWYKTGNAKVLQWLHSFLVFGKKADYEEPSFHAEAVAKWKRVEQDLDELELPDHIVRDLKKTLEFQQLHVDFQTDLVFRHGPGSVAEPGITTTTQKNAVVSYHPRLACLVEDLPPSPYRDLVLPREFDWDSVKYGLGGKVSSTVSKFRTVRKDNRSVRTMCMEPTTFMMCQQALMNGMVQAIDRSRLSSVIDIKSQERNRIAALQASEDGEFSTVDMKDASDRVSNKLVLGIFSGKLLDYMQATRTYLVQLPADEEGTEDVVAVNKFAPMGSAVCFPTQSIIFSLVAILCNHLYTTGVNVAEYISEGRSRVKNFVTTPREGTCVYGDDIIIPDCQTEDLFRLLIVLGFAVNTKKSFYGDLAVRESCGIYALDGQDITPLLFKVKGIAENTYDSILGRIALCNALFKRGYYNARNAVMRSLAPKFYVVVPPESAYATQGTAIHGYEGNPGRKPRWNKRLFRLELKTCRPHYREDHDVGSSKGDNDNPLNRYRKLRDSRNNADSRYALALWLVRPFTVVGGSHTVPISENQTLTWNWRWTPVSK